MLLHGGPFDGEHLNPEDDTERREPRHSRGGDRNKSALFAAIATIFPRQSFGLF